MVLCNVECIKKIAVYLEVSPGKLRLQDNRTIVTDGVIKNQSLQGFSTIIQALVKNSKCSGILGEDEATKALTRQWLEYAVLFLNFADSPQNQKRVLTELNQALRSNTYITGTKKSIADIALYYILYSIMQSLSHQEKAHYVNISRWFDNIQQEEKVTMQTEVDEKEEEKAE